MSQNHVESSKTTNQSPEEQCKESVHVGPSGCFGIGRAAQMSAMQDQILQSRRLKEARRKAFQWKDQGEIRPDIQV